MFGTSTIESRYNNKQWDSDEQRRRDEQERREQVQRETNERKAQETRDRAQAAADGARTRKNFY